MKTRSSKRKVKESEKREENKKKKLNKLVDTMTSGTCVICSESLSECIDNMGISSYACRCTTQRVVHTKCWTQDFRCACGEIQESPSSNINLTKLGCSAQIIEDITRDTSIAGMHMVSLRASSMGAMDFVGTILSGEVSPDTEEFRNGLSQLMNDFKNIGRLSSRVVHRLVDMPLSSRVCLRHIVQASGNN